MMLHAMMAPGIVDVACTVCCAIQMCPCSPAYGVHVNQPTGFGTKVTEMVWDATTFMNVYQPVVLVKPPAGADAGSATPSTVTVAT